MASSFGLRNSAAKMFKHLEFIPLSSIRSIVQFGDTGGEHTYIIALGPNMTVL